MTGYLAVAAGGAIGAVGRHAVNGLALRLFGPGFPWGTFAVNVAGSFLMGVLAAALARHALGAETRLFLATGVLGGFTTFSAFSLDTVILVERGAGALTLGYVVGSVLVSVLALFAGLMVVRVLS